MSARQRRGGAGTRAPHPPEYNLIQRPDLTQKIRDSLGLRQAHVIPALAENLQPVILVEDLTRQVTRKQRHFVTGILAPVVGDGLTHAALVGIWNPAGSPARVTRVNGMAKSAGNVTVGLVAYRNIFAGGALPAGWARESWINGSDLTTYPSTPADHAVPISTSTQFSSGISVGSTLGPLYDVTPFAFALDLILPQYAFVGVTTQTSLATDGFYAVNFEFDQLPETSA